MNADESVARGCTLMCAMLSPAFRVKEFKIEDCQPYPITLSWQGSINEDNEVEVFSRWNSVPSNKLISFHKLSSFVIDVRYSYPNDIPFSDSRIGEKIPKQIFSHRRKFLFQGKFTVEKIQPQNDGSPSKIKVKVRLNRNGIFEITQAVLVDPKEDPNGSNNKSKNSVNTFSFFSRFERRSTKRNEQSTRSKAERMFERSSKFSDDFFVLFFSNCFSLQNDSATKTNVETTKDENVRQSIYLLISSSN